MGIENITERIISDAQKKAAEVESGSDKESAKIRDEAKKKAESIKSQIIADAKSQAEEEKRRILAFARLEARNSVLAEKQKAISQVFDKASEELQSLPDREYEDLIKKLLIKAAVTGEEEIILSPRDKKRVTDKLIADVNAVLKADDRKGNLKVSQETREIEGGFILKAEGIEINNSFSSLLSLLREELEYKLLEILS